MKKFIINLLVITLVILSSFILCYAEEKNNPVVYVDNKEINFISAQPEILDDVLYVPINETLLYTDFTIQYIDGKWLNIIDDNNNLSILLSNGCFYKDKITSQSKPVDGIKTIKRYGEYFLPLEKFCELTEMHIIWDDYNKYAYIYTDEIIPYGSTNDLKMFILDNYTKQDCLDYVLRYNKALSNYSSKIQEYISRKYSSYYIYSIISKLEIELRHIPSPRGVCSALTEQTLDYLKYIKYALSRSEAEISAANKVRDALEVTRKSVINQYGDIKYIRINFD